MSEKMYEFQYTMVTYAITSFCENSYNMKRINSLKGEYLEAQHKILTLDFGRKPIAKTNLNL